MMKELREVKRRFKSKRDAKSPARKLSLTKKCLLMIVAATLLYAGLLEPWNIETTRYDVTIPNLPKSLDGLRIVQLSDLHRGLLTRDSIIMKAVRATNATHADIALLTGDFVSYNARNTEPCVQMLSHIKTRLGSYAVLGNHDYLVGGSQARNTLQKHGIVVLGNAHRELAKRCYLVGIDDYDFGKPDIIAAFKGIAPGTPCIIMSHNPIIANMLSHQNGFLMAGHTHGGQIRIPFLPKQLIYNRANGKFIAGWYRDGKLLFYVNRGIGMTNLPLRLACRPEVSLFILHTDRSHSDRQ